MGEPLKKPRVDFPSLENLFGSKTRVRLLWLFVKNPDRAFYVRELTREIGAQIHAVRRELENLEKIRMVSAEEKRTPEVGRAKTVRKYYKALPESILFPEISALLQKAELFLERNLGEYMENMGNFYYVILTGKLVNERDIPTDILFIGEPNKEKMDGFMKDLEAHLGQTLNYTILSPDEFHYRKSLSDRFLYNLLEGKKIVILDKRDQMPKPQPV